MSGEAAKARTMLVKDIKERRQQNRLSNAIL